jgi:hypothetical protein
VNIWVIKILKEKKINFEQIFEFFQNYEFWFFNIYLSLILKWSNIGKKIKFPKSDLTRPLIKMSHSYFIFNFENHSSLFKILIIYAFESMNWNLNNVSYGPNEIATIP